ncbi:MAG TPA: LuxR family transcriptional regulator [Microbacteriaceae bacterium]|nr:LuxR family transcriptional regulator [Microbacteriaceae bacterium]
MQTTSLNELVEEHSAKAQEVSSGRSAVTIFGGREHRLRQTLIAIREGKSLGEHASPGEATLQVLTGKLLLRSESGHCEVSAGELAPIPEEVHAVDALEDVVFLLTVSKSQRHKD